MSDWIDAEQHVERAHELFEAGRWREAETELREAIALNPYQPEWHYNLGLTLEAAGEHQKAASAFAEVFSLGEGDTQVALAVGANLLRAGQASESLAWFERAEKEDGADPASFTHRIAAYRHLGEHEQAELMFYLAQQLDPECADAYAEMADSLLDQYKHERAVWCLREAARLEPEMPKVQARLAEAYAATGRLERARQLYLRELRLDPGDIDTILDLAELLVEMNRLPEAREKYARVLEMETDNADAHYGLAQVAEQLSDLKQAATHYDVTLRLDPEFSEARRRLARLLIARGQGQDRSAALDLLGREVAQFRRNPDDMAPAELDELGLLLLDAGAPGEAIRIFRRLTEITPDESQAWRRLGLAQFHAGNRKAGMDACRRAIRLDPRSVPAMHNLALALMRERQWLRARYWVEQALRVDPEDASLRRLRMQLRLQAALVSARWLGLEFFLRRRAIQPDLARE